MKAIPTWKQRKLGEFSDVRDGTHASPKYVSQGHPMVTSKNLTHSGLDMTDVSFLTDEDFNEINKRSKVSTGDILFGMIGTIGNPVIVDRDDFAIKNVALIKEKTSNPITNKWLLQYLKSPSFNRFIQKENAGGTQKFIALGLIKDMKLRVPEFDEQQKIGAFFKKIDETIALHQEKLSKLQSLKKAALQSLFPQKNEKEPKVRFANFKEIWKQYKLKDVIESELKGKAKAKDKTNDCKNVYLETNYLNGGEVSYVDVPNDVDEDDVLILWDGSQAGTVYHGYKGALGSTLKAYKPKESGEFMFQYLKKNQQKIYDNYRTPNIPHVVKTFTEDFRIKSTSIIEQRKISSFFKQLDSTINFYQDKLEKLQLLKKAFLQKMFI